MDNNLKLRYVLPILEPMLIESSMDQFFFKLFHWDPCFGSNHAIDWKLQGPKCYDECMYILLLNFPLLNVLS